MSATVQLGRAPGALEPVSARRMDLLRKIMTFKSRPETAAVPPKGPAMAAKTPPAKEPDAPPPPGNKEPGPAPGSAPEPAPGPAPAPAPAPAPGGASETKEMVINNLAPAISTQIQPSPVGPSATVGINAGATPNMGSVGADAGAKVETDKPPPFATGKISLEFK